MATIRDIVRDGRGSAGKWHVIPISIDDGDGRVNRLYHYSTMMLQWNNDDPTDETLLDYSTGWGSVSDQGGMNQAFRALGIPLYFSRAGGAEIREVNRV